MMKLMENGRVILVGKVNNVSDSEFHLCGHEWDKELKMNVERTVSLRRNNDTKGPDIENGMTVIVCMMPDRNDPDAGIAEVIAAPGGSIAMTSAKGKHKQKVVLLGRIRNKKWSKSGKVLYASMKDVKDEDGQLIGTPSEYNYNGVTMSSYWVNLSFINSVKYNSDTADRADKVLRDGDLVAVVTTPQENTWNGRTTMQYTVGVFVLVERPQNHQNGNQGGNASNNNLPKDSSQSQQNPAKQAPPETYNDGFMNIPESELDELPFE